LLFIVRADGITRSLLAATLALAFLPRRKSIAKITG
jgi:hypothetical protein